jgi:single-strand DNA-binding protein
MAEYRVPNINRIFITGNLTSAPELRYMPDGRAVCNFQIASNYRYKDRNTGEWMDAPTTFIRVITWGPGAERAGEQLRKGSAVYIEGRLQSRTWETPEGQKRTTIEINALRIQNLSKSEMKEESEEEIEIESERSKDDLPFEEEK